MKPSHIVAKMWDIMPANDVDHLTAKQLMEISKAFNYFMAEEIQTAPCDHAGETHYETSFGSFCGTCQRRIEVTNERRDTETAAQATQS
jgi:hypothetical protein